MTLGDMLNELAKDPTKIYKWTYSDMDGECSRVGINQDRTLDRIANGVFCNIHFPLFISRIKSGIFEPIEDLTNDMFFKKEEI